MTRNDEINPISLFSADEYRSINIPSEEGVTRIFNWLLAGQPHFYKKGRLIVQYVDVSHSSDTTVRNLLENILGLQFAGQ